MGKVTVALAALLALASGACRRGGGEDKAGGQHKVVTACCRITSIWRAARKRAVSCITSVAPAFQGEKKLLQACFAQPGELMFWCTSPSRMPIQYMVDKCPTG